MAWGVGLLGSGRQRCQRRGRAAATVVAATSAIRVLVATTTTVVVTTTAVVAATTVAAAATIFATVLLSMAVSAMWALLIVDGAWRELAIADGLAEHLELPLYCHDVGRVGSK